MEQLYNQYRRKSISEMRAYIEDEILDSKVSISEIDLQQGSPKIGDMIARNPKNHSDQWLVAKEYFEQNLEPIPPKEGVIGAEEVLSHLKRLVQIIENDELMFPNFPPLVEAKQIIKKYE